MTASTKHSLPTTAVKGAPIVAVGASAGGLSALPDQTGLAWVFVVHMDPDFVSQLAKVLEVGSPLPVLPVSNGLKPKADHVYVSVPGMRLTFEEGTFHLSPCRRGKRPPRSIDTFMMSLAKALGPRVAGVLLSGSGNDGVKGLQAIQAQGGYTLVQEPGSAEFAAMAENAIAADVVNKVLPVAELAEELLHLARRPCLGKLSPDQATQTLEDIFPLLADQSGNDFGKYKRSTLQRRLEKRMQSQHISDPGEYLQLLRDGQAANTDLGACLRQW